jgi:hypothetical protein
MVFDSFEVPLEKFFISMYIPTCLYLSLMQQLNFSFLTDAYETAKMLCEQYYLVAPELEVEEFNGKRQSNLDEIRLGQGSVAIARKSILMLSTKGT